MITELLTAMLLQAAFPSEWTGVASSMDAPCPRRRPCADQFRLDRSELTEAWDSADDRHRRLILMSIEHHTRDDGTDWTGALRDYRNRAAAVAMEPDVMRQLEQNRMRETAERIQRDIRRENGTSRIVTTCRTNAYYLTTSTTCETREE